MMLQFIGVVLTASLIYPCLAKEFYVSPTLPAPDHCLSPCFTLDEYALNTSQFDNLSNISLVFLEGIHNLSHPLMLNLTDCANLFFIGPENAQTFSVFFDLIVLIGVSNLHMTNIILDGFQNYQPTLNQLLLINAQNFVLNQVKLSFASLSMLTSETSFFDPMFVECSIQLDADIVNMERTVFRGGDVYISSTHSVNIQDSCFVMDYFPGLFVINNTNHVSLHNVTQSSYRLDLLSIKNVTITESHFENNSGIGVRTLNSGLVMTDSLVTGNDVGVHVEPSTLNATASFSVPIFSNCIFTLNRDAGLLMEDTAVVRDCQFLSNQGTPIVVSQSTVELSGSTLFESNIAERGGGLALYNSTVRFGSGSNTTFINNTAGEFGGAILIVMPSLPNLQLIQRQNCFYAGLSGSLVTFSGNNALLGGMDIYGPSLHDRDCLVSSNPMFNFDKSVPNDLQVSSDPTRVCICIYNEPQCEDRSLIVLNKTGHPGETFTVSVALAGYNYGRVSGIVYANVLGGDFSDVLTEIQHTQASGFQSCTNLNYTVFSREEDSSVVLVLTSRAQLTRELNEDDIIEDIRAVHSVDCDVSTTCTALLKSRVYLNITLQPCPLGFQLDETKRMCVCDESLMSLVANSALTCEIRNNTGFINREGRVWIGVDTSENSDVYYWHTNCPHDYCNRNRLSITLMGPDEQCNLNHGGILCGGCRANHSLQLGGNSCSNECSDHFIIMLICFVAFGILLVILLKVLDLTVAQGSINGVIFYSNIITSSIAAFSIQSGSYIAVPIAWINLDFGMPVCFIRNLDQLTKTGLQFVFPVYIWCIAGLIIAVSHYSTKVTKMLGNNSLTVLSTLFLLSYGKVFRNIIDVFNFADVMGKNGDVRKVWSRDGNIQYGGHAGHIVLMVVALLFLALLLLYTAALLLVPFLRAKSNFRFLHWINKLKPFFDTYYGPFKDKKRHQAWTGILLVSRLVLLIVSTITSTSNPNANTLLMVVISVLLLLYSATVGLLYKKWVLSLSENLFLINLIITGGAFLFYELNRQDFGSFNPVIVTSVSVGLFQFACIVALHIIKRIVSIERLQSCLTKMKEKKANDEREAEQNNENPNHNEGDFQTTFQLIELANDRQYDFRYRESIFEEESVV